MITKLTYKRIILTIGILLFDLIIFLIIGIGGPLSTPDSILFRISIITAIISYIINFFNEKEFDDISAAAIFFSFVPILNIVIFLISVFAGFTFIVVKGEKKFREKFVK
jgi:hypothetical protein